MYLGESLIEPLAAGDAGTSQSIGTMRALVETDRTNPAIRRAVLEALQGAPERNPRAEVPALLAWMRERVRFVRDPVDVEYIQTPARMLGEIRAHGQAAGDCDDQATLFATLAEAAGYPTRFVVQGRDAGPYSHVIVEVADESGAWAPVDPSQRGAGLGWKPSAGIEREATEMLSIRRGGLGDGGTGTDLATYGGDLSAQPPTSFDTAILVSDDGSQSATPVEYSPQPSGSPSQIAGSGAGGSSIADAFGALFKGAASAAQTILPLAERAGVYQPVVGYDAQGNPIFASSVLPPGGAAGAAWNFGTQAGPLGLSPAAWLLIAGGAALLLLSGKRGRR